MIIDYKLILLFLTAGANIALSIFIFLKNTKSSLNRSFSVMLFFIAVWSLATGIFFTASSLESAIAISSIIYFSAASIAVSFSIFSHYFPYSVKPISFGEKVRYVLGLFFVSVLIFYFKVEHIYSNFDNFSYQTKINFLPYAAFSLCFLGYIAKGFLTLWQKYKVSTSSHRNLLKVVIFSTLISAFFGSICNLILPLFTYDYIWLGPLFTLAMVFIIIKYLFVGSN